MNREGNISWFYESASEKKNNSYVPNVSSFGAYRTESAKSFDEHFNDLCERYKTENGIDIKMDMKTMIGDRAFMEQYKLDLATPIFEGYRKASENDPHIEHLIENVERFWDTKVRLYNESAAMTGFLPIATLEFPVLLKQFFQSIIKDIIEIETTKTPNLTKHIRTTFMVINETGERFEYPKCIWDGTWEQVWKASKGLPIPETVVPLTGDGLPGTPIGRLHKFDIIGFAGGTKGAGTYDKMSFAFKIIAVEVPDGGGGSEVVPLKGNGITVEFSTNGTLVNGNLDFTAESGTVIDDTLGGRVDFKEGEISIASTTGQVTGVVFSGYLSNEKNLRTVSVEEKRDILRFTIEDGARFNMPFTIEEIEDAAALLDINYYNRMVDEIIKCQENQECMRVLQFYDDEFQKYHGTTPDIWKLESFATTFVCDLTPPVGFAGDPFKYYSSAIQFKLKSMIYEITEKAKLDNLSFIIAGNPMVTQLITEFVQWKTQNGASIGGITVHNSYGFATDIGGNVRVVASNIYDPYTADVVTPSGNRELILHIYCFPTDEEHISFKHLKYTSHLLTSQSQTAYQSTQAPGGAYNIVTATSRFKTIAIQGIQARMVLLYSNKVYQDAPARFPLRGYPWS